MARQSGFAGAPARLGFSAGALAAIATVVAVGVTVSLVPPLLSLTLSARGVPERTIGLLVSTIAAASLVASPLAPRLAARFGTARSIVCALGASAALILAYGRIEALALYFVVAFLQGIFLSVVFILSEAWIVAATEDRHRGRIMGLYATFLSLGFAAGPGLVALTGIDSIRPYLLGSAVLLVAALPAWAARRISPVFGGASHRPFRGFLLAVPLATLGVLCFAMAESGGFAFLPLWGLRLGYGEAAAPLLASAMTLGNVALQIPLGLLADRMDRRWLLLGCGLVGTLGMAAAAAASGSFALLSIVLFVWGGATAGLYTIGLAHLASRVSVADLAAANGAFIFCYSLGMLVGPVALGETMGRLPLTGFPLVLGVVFALYVAFAIGSIAASNRHGA